LVKTTDTAFWFIASRSFWGSIFRAYFLPGVFSILTRIEPVLKFMFRTISQIKIQYRESPISQGESGEIQAGDRLPWIKSSDNYANFKSLAWQIHIYGKAKPYLHTAAQVLHLAIQEFAWNAEADVKGLKENVLYLIRPDGHIALISETQDTTALKEYINSI
jgi:hypothetical protein